jgi:hypothetical protein
MSVAFTGIVGIAALILLALVLLVAALLHR